MIGEEHLLINAKAGFFLMKIDYKTWQISVVANYGHIPGSIVLDSSNHRKFIIYDSRHFITGTIKGNNIAFGPQKEMLRLFYPKLIGNQLFGFRYTGRQSKAGIPFWQYCKVDLDTLTEEAIYVPMILDDKPLDPSVSL
jgi:hypothetical protein